MNTTAKKKTSPWVWVLVGCGGFFILVVAGFLLLGVLAFKKGKEFIDNPELMYASMIDVASPELDLVKTDKEAEVFHFRHTQTGEDFMVNFSELADGKLTIRDSNGKEVFSFDADQDSGNITFGSSDGDVSSTWETSEDGTTTVKTTGPDSESSVRFDGDTAVVESQDGATVTMGESIDVERFPNWLPLWGGDTFKTVSLAESTDSVSGSYTFYFRDSLDELFTTCKNDLEAKGLSMRSESRVTDGGMSTYADGDIRHVLVMIGQADSGGFNVTVSFNEKR